MRRWGTADGGARLAVVAAALVGLAAWVWTTPTGAPAKGGAALERAAARGTVGAQLVCVDFPFDTPRRPAAVAEVGRPCLRVATTEDHAEETGEEFGCDELIEVSDPPESVAPVRAP